MRPPSLLRVRILNIADGAGTVKTRLRNAEITLATHNPHLLLFVRRHHIVRLVELVRGSKQGCGVLVAALLRAALDQGAGGGLALGHSPRRTEDMFLVWRSLVLRQADDIPRDGVRAADFTSNVMIDSICTMRIQARPRGAWHESEKCVVLGPLNFDGLTVTPLSRRKWEHGCGNEHARHG